MDEVRKVRYLVAPFFFFASLLWGNYLAGRGLPESSKEVITLAVASIFPIGFLIGAASHSDRVVLFYPERKVQRGFTRRAGSAEDLETFGYHETLSPGVQWIMRSWSGYVVSTHSFVALVPAIFIGHVFIPWTCGWWVTTLITSMVLLVNAGATWNQCTKMIEFQSMRSSLPKHGRSDEVTGSAIDKE
jgi:hypothetical protein